MNFISINNTIWHKYHNSSDTKKVNNKQFYRIRSLIFIFFCVFIVGCSNNDKNTTENTADYLNNNQNIDMNLENAIQKKFKIALKYQELDDYTKAAEIFKEIIELKDTPENRVCLGSALLLDCKYYDAIEQFALAIKRYEELSFFTRKNAFFGIVHSYIMTDQYDKGYEVAKHFYDALDYSKLTNDEKIESLMHLAKTETGIGLYDEAIAHFKQALAIEDRGYLYIGLSRALSGAGRFKEALEACYTSVSKEDSGRTRYGLAEMKWKTGDLQGALEEFKGALLKVQQTPKANYRVSRTEWEQECLRIEELIKGVEKDIKLEEEHIKSMKSDKDKDINK